MDSRGGGLDLDRFCSLTGIFMDTLLLALCYIVQGNSAVHLRHLLFLTVIGLMAHGHFSLLQNCLLSLAEGTAFRSFVT